MRKYILPTILVLLTPVLMIAQEDLGKKNNIKISQLTDKVYMLQARGGNIGLSIGADGIFMIDDQFADLSEDIIDELKKLTDEEIKLLVNTHHHGDHTGGNVNMTDAGAMIFAHENVRERLLAKIAKATQENKKIDDKILPVVTFPEDINFYFNGEEIKVFHVGNAHTDGDAMVYFTKSNVLHTGDVFFKGRYPYIDQNSGGSFEGYIQGLEKAHSMINDDTKIIPGHGAIANKNDIFYTINMLNRIYKQVGVQFSEGKTIEEIINMPEITENYDEKGYGDGFISTERILRFAYAEFEKDSKPKN